MMVQSQNKKGGSEVQFEDGKGFILLNGIECGKFCMIGEAKAQKTTAPENRLPG